MHQLNTSRQLNASRPALLLPTEVLAHIFLQAPPQLLERFTLHEKIQVGNATRSIRLLISSVCHHWREVALGTPQLWSTISIQHEYCSDYIPPSTLKPDRELFALELQRASNHSLDLILSIPRLLRNGERGDRFRPLLQSATVRSRSISGYMDMIDLEALIKPLTFSPPLPLLRFFGIRIAAFPSKGLTPTVIDLTLASSLNTLSVEGLCSVRLSNEHQCVKDLCLSIPDRFLESVELLRTTAHLHKLKWKSTFLAYPPPFTHPQASDLHFPFLEELSLFAVRRRNTGLYGSVLHSISAPQLKILKVDVAWEFIPITWPYPHQFPQLEQLSVERCEGLEGLVGALYGMPTLTKLTLPNWKQVPPGFAEARQSRGVDNEWTIVPVLQELTALFDNIGDAERVIVARNGEGVESDNPKLRLHLTRIYDVASELDELVLRYPAAINVVPPLPEVWDE